MLRRTALFLVAIYTMAMWKVLGLEHRWRFYRLEMYSVLFSNMPQKQMSSFNLIG